MDAIKTLFIATANAHKLGEIRAIFQVPSLHILDMHDIPGLPDVVEDRETFEGNACKKATELAAATGHWTLADDSGLEVDALDGAPGVYSARYAGEPADYAANNAKLLRALDGLDDRRARFRCVIALSDPQGKTRTVDGTCEGRMALTACGGQGFGYDPLFIPEGDTRTFAEMTDEEKHARSHRGRALTNAQTTWHELWGA